MAIVGQVVRALTRNDKTKIEKMLQVGDIDTLLYLKAILEYWREQEKKTILYCQGLGRRHYGFGVHVDILQLMGPHFIASIYPQVCSQRLFLLYFDNQKKTLPAS